MIKIEDNVSVVLLSIALVFNLMYAFMHICMRVSGWMHQHVCLFMCACVNLCSKNECMCLCVLIVSRLLIIISYPP